MSHVGRGALPYYWTGGPNGVAFPGSISGGAWPSANLAIFVPFTVTESVVVRRFVYTTANNTGNIDIGVYSDSGALIVSTGATAQGSTNVVLYVDCTDTLLLPGNYFMAMSCASASAQPLRTTGLGARLLGVCQMASAHPLPSTATFAAAAQDYIPAFAFSTLGADL